MLAKNHRTYSLRSNTSAPPPASLAATAAASAALSSNASSRCNSLSSQAAAAALRRYSLTQDSLRSVPAFSNYTSAPANPQRPSSVRSQRQNSQYTTTTRIVNEDRSMSLTRTTVKTLGSFELTTTKTTHLPPPTTSSHSRSTGKRPRKKKAASILSYESDLNSVMEEDGNYSFTQNFSAIHETPRTFVTPEPRPIRSSLKPNQPHHARKHSSGSRVSFSSQSSANPSVSLYVNNNTSAKKSAAVDSDSSSGNSVYSDASEFFPPVVVDIINHKRVITAPPAAISPPSSQSSPHASPVKLTPQQRRRSTYSTSERVSEYLNNKNGTTNKTKPASAKLANATLAPRKLAARKENAPPADYTKHILKRTPSSSSFERERTGRRGTKNTGGFKLKTMREPNKSSPPKQQQKLETTPVAVAAQPQQPHAAPFRSRFEDSDSDSDSVVAEMPGSVPVAKRMSPIARRFSLRSSDRESVPEPVRSPAAPKQTKFAPIAEENYTPVKPTKKKKFQGLRRQPSRTNLSAKLVISNFSANPLPRAQRPGPSDSYHDKDPSQTTDWQFIRNFTANTRNSDSLVYALARKEAFLQATHIPIKFRDNFEIVDLWVMMALRFTLKGNLLFSPMAAKQKSLVVLDLQGIFRDQFSWQIALDYPQSMVYGLCFTPGGAQNPIKPTNNCANQDSEKNYATKKSYPSNYIPCVGHSIKKLPFEDNTFDIVNAKSLWYLVKKNDWVDVLSELFRIIKPGGYIELLMADFVLLNGNATDQYWWSRLVQGVINHGLEPAPMSTIATQLYHVGFTDVNRALISLPRGWGGQMGHLTDLLAMYYSQFMFQTFSDLTSDEMVSFKTACRTSIQKGYSPANSISFTYAQKPL